MNTFLQELQRRNVHRAAVFYAGASWLLMQIASQIFPFFDIPNWAVRAVVIACIIGFPFAMLFSWFFEWTPQGIKRESEIDRSQSVTRETGRKMDRGIIAVLALAVAVLLLNQFVLHRFMPAAAGSKATAEKSIAVLPFSNTSGDAGNEYFSDGLSEELISSLSRLRPLKVIGRTSSFQFKNTSEDSKAIGEKLGVAYLLEGSVRKSSDRVRIAVELVKSTDGANVWSDSYDRELKDIFAVQSEIATAVAEQLKITLLGASAEAAATAPASSANLDAYTALLQGNYYFQHRTPEDFRKAIAYHEEAIRLDPGYAQAYAGLSVTRVLLVTSLGDDNNLIAEYIAKARVEAATALRLDPNLAEAHYAQSMLYQNADLDIAKADVEVKRALELSPQNALLLLSLGLHQTVLGQLEEGVATAQRSVAGDPLSNVARFYLGRAYIDVGRYDDAERELRKAIELQPQASSTYLQLAVVEILRGNPAAAVELAKQETSPFWRQYALSLAYFANSDHAEADEALNALIRDYANGAASQVAVVYALRKEPDRMFQWLDRAAAEHDPGVLYLRCDPFLRAYQSDPRYAALATRLGVADTLAKP